MFHNGSSNRWPPQRLLLVVVMAILQTAAMPARGAPEPGAPRQQAGQAQDAASNQSQASDDAGTDLDDQVIHDVFSPFEDGIQALNLDQILGIFDKDNMPDYAQVRDQVRAFLNRYESVSLRYRLLQVTSEKDSASAIVEIQMDAVPADSNLVSQRRDLQMRFQMKRGPKGWRVISFRPDDFFAQ